MELKNENINIYGLKVQMQPVLKHAENIWRQYGHELVITSARDGVHSAGSYHYYGFAVDLRTHYFKPQNKHWLIAAKLRKQLLHYSDFYDVVVHPTHIHVEYDFWRAAREMSLPS
jgi:hypothetical protein